MNATSRDAYSLAIEHVYAGECVALVPVRNAELGPFLYMRYVRPSVRETLIACHPDDGVRAGFAFGLVQGSRMCARERGLTLA